MTETSPAQDPAGQPLAREFDAVLPRIVWGPDCTSLLHEQLSRIGASRAMLLCGRTVGASPWFAALRDGLGPRCVGVYGEVEPHTPIAAVRGAAAMARAQRADALVMVGGGAVQDAGKLAALTLAEGDNIEDFKVRWTEDRRLLIPALSRAKMPLVAIPTTLSAAEVVGAATYVDGEQRFVIVDRGLLPRVVMYDPRIAATTPRDLFLGTGMNAVAHCVDAICSVRAQPFSEALAVGALRQLVGALADCAREPAKLAAIEQAQVGAAISGVAYSNTWLGIAHSLCQALGARYRVPQGFLHAVMLPHAMRYNAPATKDREALIRNAIADGLGSRVEAGNADSATLMERFRDAMGLPKRLRDIGVPGDALGLVAQDTFVIWHTYFNPRRVKSPEELREVLAAAW